MARLIVGLAAAASLVAGGTVAVTEVAQAKDQARVAASIGTVHAIGTAAQAAARSYWTPPRRAAATAAVVPGARASVPRTAVVAKAPATQRQAAVMGASVAAAQGPPRGTPGSWSFGGVPTVGALFYTTGSKKHFCTASVIHSTVGSLVVTAAHCVYSGSAYSRHVEFIPGYNSGAKPYGVWPVTQITVAKGWRKGQNPDLDVAFLDVVPPPNSVGPIEQVTGGLRIAFGLPDARHITVIGYNDTGQRPIMCNTKSFKFRRDQMAFYCRGFWYGTSGGPWILNYSSASGTGTVYGVIGGYQAGGYVEWASYSAAFEKPAQELLAQAEATAGAVKSGTSTGKSAGTQVTAAVG
jgi:V8-like Glu-specific endopeptidase